MAIEFHCDHCGKLIRTAEDNAGKRGKCPSCHQSVYIPTPADQLEPLNLAPVDDAAERAAKRLLDESRRLANTLRHERQSLDRGPAPANAGPASSAAPRDPAVTHADVEQWVLSYAIAMADGQLDKAERLAQSIRQNRRIGDEVIDRLMVDEMPPASIARIPRPVLIQFLKQLRAR